jgi:alanine racemase
LKSYFDWIHQKDRYSLKDTLKVHLKLDTGMHRLGFPEVEWRSIQEAISLRTDIEVVSIFTHLSSADLPNADDFTQRQLNELSRAKDYFSPYFPRAFYHCANTAAIDRFPAAQMDMVRLGIGLYGVAATSEDQSYLQPVHRWISHISQITSVKEGEPVGYGMSDVSVRERVIATVPVGYADGFKRILSNGVGKVMIQNQSCITVGRICMDMMMVDVTGLNVKEGDEVILLGEGRSLQEWAKDCQTIPYEILTSISQRVKRIYIQA